MFFKKNQLYFPALPQNFPKLSLFLFFSNLSAIYVCLIYLMSYTVINNKKTLKHYVCHFGSKWMQSQLVLSVCELDCR